MNIQERIVKDVAKSTLTCKNIEADLELTLAVRKFQVMPENCRKISRYAGKEFHLMTESSS
jgi:hypothetical protein